VRGAAFVVLLLLCGLARATTDTEACSDARAQRLDRALVKGTPLKEALALIQAEGLSALIESNGHLLTEDLFESKGYDAYPSVVMLVSFDRPAHWWELVHTNESMDLRFDDAGQLASQSCRPYYQGP